LSEFNDTIIVLGKNDANFKASSPTAWWELRGVPYNGRSVRLDGGSGEDVLTGGDGTDVFWGGDGDDRLLGKKGNDYLHGGLDIDLMMGGSGNDVITSCSDADCSLMDDQDADHADGGSGRDRLWLGDHSTAVCGAGYDYNTQGAYFKHGCEANASAPSLVPKVKKSL
jgi:Ca2+-binding RTX toxin-like protein